MNLVDLQNSVFRILIDTGRGTGISAFFVKKDGRQLPVMPDTRWERSDLTFAAFLMIPYSNRIENGRFTFMGNAYRLSNGENHAIHGDVRYRPWQVEKIENHALVCWFRSRTFDNINWPWALDCRAEYAVSGNRFSSRLTLWNRADTPMPAGMGWHPYFSRQLGKPEEPVHLCFKTETVYPDADDSRIPSGPPGKVSEDQDFSKEKPLDPETFLDACFFDYDGNGTIFWPESGLRVSFDCSPECSHLIMYNPPKPYFAVEPVTNANNGVNLMAQGEPTSGIAVLEPGEYLSARFSLRVEFL